MTSGAADGDVVGGGAAALCGRNLPVIVAEIRVQRVQIETHSHGGAHQLRDHLSKPTWERILDRNDWNQVPSSLSLSSLCVIVLSIQPLGSAALQTTRGISHVTQSVSKFAIFPLTHCAERRQRAAGGEVKLPPGLPRSRAHVGAAAAAAAAAVSSACASLCLGTGESGAGRRMWFSGRRSMRSGLCAGEERWRGRDVGCYALVIELESIIKRKSGLKSYVQVFN